MNQAVFYVYALLAVIAAAVVLRRVITCLMRSLVLLVLVGALALGYYLFIGQYDEEVQQMVHDAQDAIEKARKP